MGQIGQPLQRIEDDRLLRGKGAYVADLWRPGTLEVYFLRSPQAHAIIRSIDVSNARSAPGVVQILTANDIAGRTAPLCIMGDVHTPERLQRELKPLDRVHPIALLPITKVTYVGQPLAVIVAESRYAAIDAAELIEVDFEALPALVDPVAALQPDAPRVEPAWNDNLALAVSACKGDPQSAFECAPVVIEEEFRAHRHVPAPIEPRGLQMMVEPVSGVLTVWAATQTPHILQGVLATSLRIPTERIRVVACDVGGGFGQKGLQYVEDVLVALAALDLGRPVRWIEERGENLIAASHARDQLHRIAVAATEEGRILAVRDDILVNLGAFNVLGLVVPYNTLSHLLGPYDVANAEIKVRGVLTNTCFTTPYRGAGRPEAVFAMERIIDRLALKLGLEPADVRARNLVPESAMPYDTGFLYRDGHAQVYDSGNFPELLRRARVRVGLEELRARQRSGAGDERLRGVGFAMYVEGTGMGPFEGATIRILSSGRVSVATGACSAGQGHQTVYAQVAADALGVPIDAIDVMNADTAAIPFGIGSIASRSMVNAGNAIREAALKVRERLLGVAEKLLEVPAASLEMMDGGVRVRDDCSRAVTLSDIVHAASSGTLRQAGQGDGRLAVTCYFSPPTVTYASGAHAAVVAVDPETGEVVVERYVVVHDCGRIVNPLLAEGQIVGGVAQGIGGALLEELVYDERGQPLTGSFMDYALPVAADIPSVTIEHLESLSPRNPLGVKGLGEAGAIASPAVIANAVEDALRPLGVVVRRGPLGPQRVWEMIAAATRASTPAR